MRQIVSGIEATEESKLEIKGTSSSSRGETSDTHKKEKRWSRRFRGQGSRSSKRKKIGSGDSDSKRNERKERYRKPQIKRQQGISRKGRRNKNENKKE